MAVTFSDQEIRQNIWDEISHDTRIDRSNITVRVGNGIVNLDGTVPTYSAKIVAGQDARRIKGVVGVLNSLAVSPARPWSDTDVREAIRRSVDRDARIGDSSQVQVAAYNGVVTLTGAVPTYAQKVAAADDAWTAPGVVDVNNEIVVTPAQYRGDAEIQADVLTALATDPDINAAQITVRVVGGTVYLQGQVPAYVQIEGAATDAWGEPGVRDVVNGLAVS